MPPKRTRRTSPAPAGLKEGEKLKRQKLVARTRSYSAWDWAGSEVLDAADITLEHRLATCGLSKNSIHPLCANKYAVKPKPKPANGKSQEGAEGEQEEDVIVISDDDIPSCNSRTCKSNPYCLNYLGQEKWENEDKAREAFLKVVNLGEDPIASSRAAGHPVGLKNLGATCYANAYLQVWFQDVTFRNGVYRCQLPESPNFKLEDSPIFQLQVTFAAMQEGKESAFNPIRLVESLKLRTTEQQDAQEFSKLFMAHLDTEFKKQSDPALKTLIPDQFQGKQVYGTICQNCHHRSERESDFLEIEVNIKNNATLEERIAAALEPETLSGDNRYKCPTCNDLQDAKRYTEIRELPPVLHFSLLRFVYDLSTMERKKTKNTICFPTFIDMNRFLGSTEDRNRAKKTKHETNQKLYELRGVLLHRGASAYHGHYEAQVYDVQNQAWYQFNDDVVTKIDTLSSKDTSQDKLTIKADHTSNGEKKVAQQQSTRTVSRRRQRVDESDLEIEIVEQPQASNGDGSSRDRPMYISSKDAYMLVYSQVANEQGALPSHTSARASPSSRRPSRSKFKLSEAPSPPPQARQAVHQFNFEHERACAEYTNKATQAKAQFELTRQKIMEIYRSWNLTARQSDAAVVSCQALETWLLRHLRDSPRSPASPPQTEWTGDDNKHQIISDLVCEHDKIDPDKANDIKLITQAAREQIASEDACEFLPLLTPSDVCDICVKAKFNERLYQMQHPLLVARFDEITPAGEDEPGYWISKQWLKDWKLAKPKMHVAGEGDVAPDSGEFRPHVSCDHGGLSANITARRRISVEAYQLLKELFPGWTAIPTDTEQCAVCEAFLHFSKEDKREIRRQAEEEKARLRHMHGNALNNNTAALERVPCAIVPAKFIRSWRQWLLRPGDVPRPDVVDNSQFLCEHGLLSLDPNSTCDMDTSIAIIKRSDWDLLERMYSAGPLIAIENTGENFTHEIPVCDECRLKKRSAFEVTEVTVRVLGPNEPIPTAATSSADSLQQAARLVHSNMPITYGSRRSNGLRQSSRIRQGREGKRHRVTITKTMTVKDLKILFQSELNIPVISQRIFYQRQELDDSSATILSLGILANDFLDLVDVAREATDISDSERKSLKRTKVHEGQGFDGTLLSGVTEPEPDSEPCAQTESNIPQLKSCSACTFANAPDVLLCEMCSTPF